jgi:hypothetical protein
MTAIDLLRDPCSSGALLAAVVPFFAPDCGFLPETIICFAGAQKEEVTGRKGHCQPNPTFKLI